MSASPYHARFRAIASEFEANSETLETPTSTAESLCGEDLDKETGTLNDIYYIFYRSSSDEAPSSIPVILWLSGGPGCSGLVAVLFENGPCMFDDEANTLSLNPYSWTSVAHVIYVDQPRGTGFSVPVDESNTPAWSANGATQDLHKFLDRFFAAHQDLQRNDFFVFGESFAGHYVPDLAASLLSKDANSIYTSTLKGVGIGNGVVSTSAVADSFIPFARTNAYNKDLLGDDELAIRAAYNQYHASQTECNAKRQAESTINTEPTCVAANDDYDALRGLTTTAVVEQGWNVYDMRRECHADDPVGLCYRFDRLEQLVNRDISLQYFGESGYDWKLCNMGMSNALDPLDAIEESESNVVKLLKQGVRVLVYGGDADTVVNWDSMVRWTRALVWEHQSTFQSAAVEHLFCSAATEDCESNTVGLVQSARGLSLVKIYHAGHVRCDAFISFHCTTVVDANDLLCVVCRWFLTTNQQSH